MPLDGLGVSRGFLGEDVSGGETMDRGPANCGVACSGRSGITSTSRSPVEDAGDGGSSDVSAEAGQAKRHRPHYSQTAVREC